MGKLFSDTFIRKVLGGTGYRNTFIYKTAKEYSQNRAVREQLERLYSLVPEFKRRDILRRFCSKDDTQSLGAMTEMVAAAYLDQESILIRWGKGQEGEPDLLIQNGEDEIGVEVTAILDRLVDQYYYRITEDLAARLNEAKPMYCLAIDYDVDEKTFKECGKIDLDIKQMAKEINEWLNKREGKIKGSEKKFKIQQHKAEIVITNMGHYSNLEGGVKSVDGPARWVGTDRLAEKIRKKASQAGGSKVKGVIVLVVPYAVEFFGNKDAFEHALFGGITNQIFFNPETHQPERTRLIRKADGLDQRTGRLTGIMQLELDQDDKGLLQVESFLLLNPEASTQFMWQAEGSGEGTLNAHVKRLVKNSNTGCWTLQELHHGKRVVL